MHWGVLRNTFWHIFTHVRCLPAKNRTMDAKGHVSSCSNRGCTNMKRNQSIHRSCNSPCKLCAGRMQRTSVLAAFTKRTNAHELGRVPSFLSPDGFMVTRPDQCGPTKVNCTRHSYIIASASSSRQRGGQTNYRVSMSDKLCHASRNTITHNKGCETLRAKSVVNDHGVRDDPFRVLVARAAPRCC